MVPLVRVMLDVGSPTGDPTIPKRLAVDPRHEFYDPVWSERVKNIYVNGTLTKDIDVYDAAEGWVRQLVPTPSTSRLGHHIIRGVVTVTFE